MFEAFIVKIKINHIKYLLLMPKSNCCNLLLDDRFYVYVILTNNSI